MRTLLALCTTLTAMIGCTTPATVNYAPKPDRDGFDRRPVLTESLFPEDQAVLSNDTIEDILGARVIVPTDARVAIIRISEHDYRWWSHELAQLDEEISDRFIDKLTGSTRVANAAVLPTLLMPQRMTVPHIRAAAARYQADVVLLYRSSSRTYTKQRFFKADQIRAHCVVEALLLDVRTGIVPFCTTASQSYTTEKSKDELTFREALWQAELGAVGQALDEIAGELVHYLDALPRN